MSVYCDKFVCYSIDIMNEWESLTEKQQDFWSSNWSNNQIEEHEKINFIPYYNKIGALTNKITILYDGMSGEYCKLIYVVDYERDANEEDCDNIVKSINSLLNESPVPFSIKQNMKEVYKAIFGKDLNMTSSIKATYLVHWH